MSEISNPYHPGQPVADPAMLFGRQDAADWIDLQIGGAHQTLVLSALPRVGKTSFLRHVGSLQTLKTLNLLVTLPAAPETPQKSGKRGQPQPQDEQQPLNIVLQTVIEQLIPQLNQLYLLDTPQPPALTQPASTLRQLFTLANTRLDPEQHLLLFFDNLHLLVTDDKSLIASFLTSLMPLLDECPTLHLVLAINQSQLRQVKHPLLDGAPTYNLGVLAADAAINMITRPVKDVLRFDYGVTKRIAEVNSNHPYYLTLYCHTLLNRQVHDGWVNQQDFDNTLTEILETPVEPFTTIWQDSTPAERAVLASMAAIHGAHGPIIDREIIRYLQGQDSSVDAAVIMNALRTLAERGVLIPMGAVSFRFHVEMLRFWLRVHTTPAAIIADVNWSKAAAEIESAQKSAKRSARPAPRRQQPAARSRSGGRALVWISLISLILLCLVALMTVAFTTQLLNLPLAVFWGQPGATPAPAVEAALLSADDQEVLPLTGATETPPPVPAEPIPIPSPTPALVVARSLPSITYMARDIDQNWRVYVMDADGSNPNPLTPEGEADDTSPVWSPDGSRIAFVSRRDGNREIYIMDSNGENLVNVTRHPADDWTPAWSPDGSQLTFSSFREGSWEIYILNTACLTQPDTCPDSLSQLTNDGNGNLSPVWSPDGSRFAYNSKVNGNWDIYTMAVNGADIRQVTISPENELAPAWSPDGSRIAYESNQDGNVEIYVIGANGGIATNVSNLAQANDHGPTWSPDGQQLVFYSNREGNWDIFVTSVDGVTVTNLTNTPSRDEQTPTWRP